MSIGLSDNTFRLNDTGVTLNTDAVLPFVDITKVSGLDNAPYRETLRDHEGVDGGFIDAEFEKGRDIILESIITCSVSNIEAYLDSLKANFAPVTTPIPFYFKAPNVVERVIFVKPRGIRYDWETARRIGTTNAQLMMYAEDPRIYDSTLTNITVNYGGDSGFGLAFSFAFSVDFGGGAVPAGTAVINSGNRDTPVIFTITGPITNPIIYNTTSGHSLAFNITLAAAETLLINTRDHTVYFAGNQNRRNTLTNPDWFFFVPGTNQIVFSGLTGTGSTLNIQFRSAWR